MTIFQKIFGRQAPQATSITRSALSSVAHRSLDGAAGGRRGAPLGTFGNTNSEVGASAEIVARRAAYLAQNNPWISNGVGNLQTYLAGTGARPAPRAADADARRDLVARFDLWAEDADHAGRTDFFGLQAILARDLVVSGEALALIHDGSDGLRVQALPPELLDRSRTGVLADGRYMSQGVEFDADGRRIAYHILPERPESMVTVAAPAVRVTAADVVHVVHPLGPGQVRGLSWLAPAILPASELDALQDALLVSAKVAALHAGFIRDLSDAGTLDWDGETVFEPGALTRLPSGTTVEFNSPQQLREAPALVRTSLRGLAAALGVPSHMLDGDLTDANYSSLRAGLLPFKRRIEAVQYGTLVPQLLRPVWRRWLAREALEGRSEAVLMACDWVFPKFEMIDPGKDIAATREALDAGLTSRSAAIAELGWNADDVDTERAADAKREASLGLTEKGGSDAA